MSEEVQATVSASEWRRWLAILLLVGLGFLMVYFGFSRATGLFLQICFMGFGIALVLLAERMRRATEVGIELTESELRETGGRRLCRFEDIAKVDRGAFAFKPSNGLVLHLKEPAQAVWAPGLWWRFGRRVGIGGVTSAAEAKALADILNLRLSGILEEVKKNV